jgi:hypothetical protein
MKTTCCHQIQRTACPLARIEDSWGAGFQRASGSVQSQGGLETRAPAAASVQRGFLKPALLFALLLCCGALPAQPAPPSWFKDASARLEKELVAKHGEARRAPLQRGLQQVGQFWQAADGEGAVFETFVRENFADTQATLDTLFDRFQRLLEKLDGHTTELRYEFKRQTDLDLGLVLPCDEIFSGYEPAAHVTDDFFRNKLAFVVLLNFPLTTLEQRLADGPSWTRRQWAEVRLAQRFSKRIPSEVNQLIAEAQAEAELYINEYKICLHHLLDDRGGRLFPPRLRLITHWNLRDEIKAQYRDPQEGPARQRLIQRVLERIIDQSIPAAVINEPRLDWNPFSNEVKLSPVRDLEPANARAVQAVSNPEPDTRYEKWLQVFQACRRADPYSPTAPTLIARRFEDDRQMSEVRVKGMLVQLLTSEPFAQTGGLIERRLGRPLEPFDLWYDSFRPPQTFTEAQLDARVRKKYPTAATYREDMPKLLAKLGFSRARAAFLQENIDVESSRGTGHAMGGAMRGQKARLRTHVEREGMNFKGYNIALHEMGHNIEQTFSLNLVDFPLLQGVPNNAFTEALAMATQGHDLELLGLSSPGATGEALKILNDFWATCEIAGMALVDMAVWHWMYEHPNATPAELKLATLQIAKETWNQYYAPVFKQRDVILLAVYSHMIRDILYLPDYPVGHLIAFQVEQQMKKAGRFGVEFERVAKFGNLTPDLWMQNAVGAPVGAEPMLAAAREALRKLAPSAP